MGENKHIKELDSFTKKYVKEIEQEQPSLNFTENLMQKIALETKSSVIKSKSLISKKGWFGIVVLLVSSLVIAFYQSGESRLDTLNINFSFLDKLQFTNLFEVVTISNTTLYAFLFFGLMIAFQITYLKNYFDKRASN